MSIETQTMPLVLAIGGHDPSGGAGIQADIEAIGANGAHAVTVTTCLTIQDSCNVMGLHPVDPTLITAQAEAIFADCSVSAIKIGLLGSLGAAQAVVNLLRRHRGIPVVLDPVLSAGGGSELAGTQLLGLIRSQLLALCDLVTPNTHEARRLTHQADDGSLDASAHKLLELGAGAVLITGTHEATESSEITHRLHRQGQPVSASVWQRLAGEFHGSGCTLASAIAARLALGDALESAVQGGLEYTWLSLLHGFRSGRCQSLPDRLFSLSRGHPLEEE
jgi:hydroxymethylpyrimidine/phosphomethylpyrimidine kinase